MVFKINDCVILKSPFYHYGIDLGGREAIVKDITSYILVEIKNYHSNPIKCFRYDLIKKDDQIKEEFGDLFKYFGT